MEIWQSSKLSLGGGWRQPHLIKYDMLHWPHVVVWEYEQIHLSVRSQYVPKKICSLIKEKRKLFHGTSNYALTNIYLLTSVEAVSGQTLSLFPTAQTGPAEQDRKSHDRKWHKLMTSSGYLSQSSLHTVSSYDDTISLIRTPGLKQLPWQTTLHHARTSHNDTRSHIFKLINILRRTGGRFLTPGGGGHT